MKFNADILQKYLNGKFSLDDKILVDEFFEDSSYSNELSDTLKDYWEEIILKPNENTPNLEPVLNRINHQILLSSRPTGRARKIWRLYSGVAAILLLPVLLFTFYHVYTTSRITNSSWVEVHSPHGARTQFSLPDGSTGWLNGGSVIKYPVQFGSSRNVTLSGEAYFEVTKNPVSPFVIDANKIKIKVLGTSFNVFSYQNDSVAEVVVADGKVEVTNPNLKFKEILFPSDRLTLNTIKNSYSKSTVDVKEYISWKSGKLIFNNDPLTDVIRRLSRFYNVEFEVKENVDRNQLFRAFLEEESLEEVLRYMKMTMDIDYTIQERKVDQENKVSRQKIIISKAITNKTRPM